MGGLVWDLYKLSTVYDSRTICAWLLKYFVPVMMIFTMMTMQMIMVFTQHGWARPIVMDFDCS